MRAPFPYFGGKSKIAPLVWRYLGTPKQYIEPFCGSAAVLLSAPRPAPLEVINDHSGFIANFWRATKHQPDRVAEWADYPVSHVDLGARHRWLLEHAPELSALQDPEWPGDAQIAGWWLWGQCCWIGSGWCDASKGQIPHASDAGMGIQALGKIPHASNAGRGIQALGQIPHAGNAGRGMLTSGGATALRWLRELSARLDRVRVVCGDWHRCLNRHYGGADTAVFLDPPYDDTEKIYGEGTASVTTEVVEWCRENADARIVLCGHVGDYDLGWQVVTWERGSATYGGGSGDTECLWLSPACERTGAQLGLFGGL